MARKTPRLSTVAGLTDLAGYVIDTVVYGKDKVKAYRRYCPEKIEDDDAVKTAIKRLEKSQEYYGVVDTLGDTVINRLWDETAKGLLKQINLRVKLLDEAEELVETAEGHKEKANAIRVASQVANTDILPMGFDQREFLTRADNVHVIAPADVVKGLIE